MKILLYHGNKKYVKNYFFDLLFQDIKIKQYYEQEQRFFGFMI